MDINNSTPQPQKAPVPAEWTWLSQRQQTDDADSVSIWKFGFVAPDGGEVRVTFHQVGKSPAEKQAMQGDPNQNPVDQNQPQQDNQQNPDPNSQESDEKNQGDSEEKSPDQSQGDPNADSQDNKEMDPQYLSALNNTLDPQSGGDPSAADGLLPPQGPPPHIPIPGQPNTDQTNDAVFYVTFFASRNPQFFMKWDTSLDHEDSLTVWVTVTHGIVDFVHKAKPSNIILDDQANGKLKMVLRSVALDVVAANPEYTLEQTQKNHYRSFFQIKQQGAPSAFADSIQGTKVEGDTKPLENSGDVIPSDKTQDNTIPQPQQNINQKSFGKQEFPASDPSKIDKTPIGTQTVQSKKGFTLEIGRDYSVAVKDKQGNAVDRYIGKNPADLLRWINTKGYGANKMKIVPQELPSSNTKIQENTVILHKIVSPTHAALLNTIVSAKEVRCNDKNILFVFESDKDMIFKKTLVEYALEQFKEDMQQTEIQLKRIEELIANEKRQLKFGQSDAQRERIKETIKKYEAQYREVRANYFNQNNS